MIEVSIEQEMRQTRAGSMGGGNMVDADGRASDMVDNEGREVRWPRRMTAEKYDGLSQDSYR